MEEVELIDKKGYLTISLSLAKEGSKILLRKPEGIREWYQDLKVRREKVQSDLIAAFSIPPLARPGVH